MPAPMPRAPPVTSIVRVASLIVSLVQVSGVDDRELDGRSLRGRGYVSCPSEVHHVDQAHIGLEAAELEHPRRVDQWCRTPVGRESERGGTEQDVLDAGRDC